jgi:hypothetical protein
MLIPLYFMANSSRRIPKGETFVPWNTFCRSGMWIIHSHYFIKILYRLSNPANAIENMAFNFRLIYHSLSLLYLVSSYLLLSYIESRNALRSYLDPHGIRVLRTQNDFSMLHDERFSWFQSRWTICASRTFLFSSTQGLKLQGPVLLRTLIVVSSYTILLRTSQRIDQATNRVMDCKFSKCYTVYLKS